VHQTVLVVDGSYQKLVEFAQLYVEMVSKSGMKNVMMPIQKTMTVAHRHAQSNHAISVAYVMDGCIHGPTVHARLCVGTVFREVMKNVMMAIQTTMMVAHRHAQSSPVT
jgi:hypothetical protein